MIATIRTMPDFTESEADEPRLFKMDIPSHGPRYEDALSQHALAAEDIEFLFQAISHDLRSPLATLSILVQMLGGDYGQALGPGGRGMVKAISQSLDSMERILTGYVQFVRNDFPLLTSPQSMNMNDLVHEVISEEQRASHPREIQFEVSELPKAQGDPAMFRQVWINLISNAVKFSRSRSVIKIKITGKECAGRLTYQISDNGIGFNPANTENLFSPFHRLPNGAGIGGLGLGLSLAKRIIERHRGQISADGRPGEGATFTFNLPANPGAVTPPRIALVDEY
jgi:signal transduction histidine kinase